MFQQAVQVGEAAVSEPTPENPLDDYLDASELARILPRPRQSIKKPKPQKHDPEDEVIAPWAQKDR